MTEDPGGPHGGALLLVEDNPGDARLFRSYLEDGGLEFDLQSASSLAEGLAAIEEEEFSAVFLDLELPDSQGLETVERCVAEVPSHTAVIVLTGLEDSEMAVQAVQAGADEYLVKGELDPRRVTRTLRLVLERRRARRLRISEEEHRLLFQRNPQPMFLFDPESGRIVSANERMLELYGYALEEVADLEISELWAGGGGAGGPAPRGPTGGRRGVRESGPWRHQREDGSELIVQTTTSSVTWRGEERRLVSVHDVTRRVELEERLRHQALHDRLTDLPNRVMFHQRLEQELARGRRHDLLFGLLLIDLDRFKEIDDSLRHTAGDRVLSEVGRRLKREVRREDRAARGRPDPPAAAPGRNPSARAEVDR